MAANITRILLSESKLVIKSILNAKFCSSFSGSYEFIKTEKVGINKNIAVITLDRPKVNVLNNILIKNVNRAIDEFEIDDYIRTIIITGNGKTFSAGGDLKAMKNNTFSKNVKENFLENLSRVTKCKKPVIAAVNGYALGGGFELAIMCDIIYASNKAKFGLPELVLATIPSSGGTQRLTRIVGKSKAMEILLSGNLITANEAEKMGLVSKVFPQEQLLEETICLAEKISSYSPLIVGLCKESVNCAYEMDLKEGLKFEKSLFHATFATKDREEGMKAFIEKRTPNFINQ